MRRRGRTGWAATATALLGTVGALLGGATPAQAGIPMPEPAVAYYMGDNGGLWHYSRAADGTITPATQTGSDKITTPGAHVAAVAVSDQLSAVFFVGGNGAVYESCPEATQPVPVTGTSFATPGGPVTAASVAGRVYVAASAVKPGVQLLASARPAVPVPLEISNPCTVPTQVAALTTAMQYSGGDLASAAPAGDDGVFYADSAGAVRAQWIHPDKSVSTEPLTAPKSTAPGAGVAAVVDESGTLTVFFAGPDGRLRLLHPKEGGGVTTPVPNPTGPANVPAGAHLSAAPGLQDNAVSYAAGDGSVVIATVSLAGTWTATSPITAANFAAAGASTAIHATLDGHYDDTCGNGWVPVVIHGPLPGPPQWWPAGPPNLSPQAFLA